MFSCNWLLICTIMFISFLVKDDDLAEKFNDLRSVFSIKKCITSNQIKQFTIATVCVELS